MISGGRFYVYAHTTRAGVFYIGKGHGNRAFDVKHRSEWWKRIHRKHGREVVILENGLTEEDAFTTEKFYIAYYGKTENGGTLVNKTDGGEGTSGLKDSPSTVEKRRARRHSEETKSKLRGKKHSEETRRKMSLAHRGRIVSEETRAKLRGRRISEETRNKLRSRVASQETRQKLREANLGRKHTEKTKAKMRGRKVSEESRKKMCGRTIGPEQREALSRAHKGKTISEAHKEAIRNRVISQEERERMAAGQRGRKHTQEELDKGRATRARIYAEKEFIGVRGRTGNLLGTREKGGKWEADCKGYIGRFDTEELAHEAYCIRRKELTYAT